MDIWTVAALPSRFGAESGNIRLTFSWNNTIHIIRDSFRKSEQRHFAEMSWNSTQDRSFIPKVPGSDNNSLYLPPPFDSHSSFQICINLPLNVVTDFARSSIHWMSPAHTSINWTAPRRVKTREPAKRKWGMENDDDPSMAESATPLSSPFHRCRILQQH